MTQDIIVNLLTRIQNATLVQHSRISISFNKKILPLVKILFKEGLIKSYQINFQRNYKKIEIILRYTGRWMRKPLYSKLFKISKSGQRYYLKYKDYNKFIFTTKNINNIFVISTSNGLMTHTQASQYRKGGEIICCIHK